MTNLAAASISIAAEAIPQCPKNLSVIETVTAIPSGFHPYVDGNPPLEANSEPIQLPLRQIMFSDGVPVDQGWLSPSNTKKASLTWDLRGSSDQGIWVSCAYTGTAIIISAKLPQPVTQCQVLLEDDSQTAKTFSCR